MNMRKTYLRHNILLALWRRKSGALALLMVATVLILFLQYHVVQHDEPHSLKLVNNNAAQRTLRTLDLRPGLNGTAAEHNAVPSGSAELESDLRHNKKPGAFDGGLGAPANELLDQPKLAGMAADSARQVDGDETNHRDSSSLTNVAEKWRSDVRYSPYQKSVAVAPENHHPVLQPLQMERDHNRPGYHSNNGAGEGEVESQQNYYGGGGSHFGAAQALNRLPYIPKHRLFHLDMKGAPPKIGYLRKIFPLMKKFGATGVLVEYEDMFPYDGDLAVTTTRNRYSRADIQAIMELCHQHEFEPIPLIQTFGHVEFILKHREFIPLREVPAVPQAFCPSLNETMTLVEDMIDQVVALHPGIRWLHIGCDEVFQMGMCPKCMARSMNDGRDVLFLSHVSKVARYVRDRYPGIIPIIWDDMLHHFTAESLKRYDMGNLVEPMVWTYVQEVYRFIPPDIWAMYAEVFPHIWTAGAFKGAFGETLAVPLIKRHVENNVAWLEVMAREEGRLHGGFRGLVLTGWQRYDHFATLCELLPAALPSLAVNLLTITHGFFNETWMNQLYDGLQCMKSPKYTHFINLDADPYLWEHLAWCMFPGVAAFKMTERMDDVTKKVNQYVTDETVGKAWLNEYNVRHNFTSISRVDAALANFPFHYPDVESLIRNARDALLEVFDQWTVAEWIELKVYPLLRKLDLMRQTAESLKRPTVWPARPLEPLPELRKYGVGIFTNEDDGAAANGQNRKMSA